MNKECKLPEKDKGGRRGFSFALLIFSLSLFLSSMNFINKYFYFLFFCFAVLFIFGTRSLYINASVAALFGISFSYLIFNSAAVAYSITGIIKQFVYPLSYLCGLNCLKLFDGADTEIERAKKREKGFVFLCYVIAAGILAHVILNLSINQSINDRNILDFWGGASSATCNAAMFCFGIGMIPALLLNKSGIFGKIFAIGSLIAFLFFALILAGRTFFLLFLIVFVLSLLFSAYKSGDFRKAFRIILIVSVVALVLILLYMQNAFGAKDIFESSNFYERFFGKWAMDLTEDGRSERKLMYYANMFYPENMFGGGNLRLASNNKYAHELYLDLLSDAGIFAYLITIFFVFSRTYRAVRLAANKNSVYSKFFAVLIFGIFLSLNIEFFIEPILQGVPWLFPTFCLVCGMVDYMILKAPTEKGETKR